MRMAILGHPGDAFSWAFDDEVMKVAKGAWGGVMDGQPAPEQIGDDWSFSNCLRPAISRPNSERATCLEPLNSKQNLGGGLGAEPPSCKDCCPSNPAGLSRHPSRLLVERRCPYTLSYPFIRIDCRASWKVEPAKTAFQIEGASSRGCLEAQGEGIQERSTGGNCQAVPAATIPSSRRSWQGCCCYLRMQRPAI